MLETILTTLFIALAAVHVAAISLFLMPSQRTRVAHARYCPPVSVIIPSHNEEQFIESSIRSVLDAEYGNTKEIIVVDDGSDRTAAIAKRLAKEHKEIRVFSVSHRGKAHALNYGVAKARFDTIVYMDGDSVLGKNALRDLVAPLAEPHVGGASGGTRARHTGPLTWFQDIDYTVISGWRYVASKVNAIYEMHGFGAFRKAALKKIGGFGTDTLTEDIDTALSLRRRGFDIRMTGAVLFTSAHATVSGLFKQRVRWGRGAIQVAKKHADVFFLDRLRAIGSFSFPMHLFWYLFALLYLPFAIYWVVTTYAATALAGGAIATVIFLVKWFTLYGILDLIYQTAIGSFAITPLTASIMVAWTLSFAYLLLCMRKFGTSARTLVAYFFVFPYYWMIFAMQAAAFVRELFSRRAGENKWDE